jgi:hypothetical protein
MAGPPSTGYIQVIRRESRSRRVRGTRCCRRVLIEAARPRRGDGRSGAGAGDTISPEEEAMFVIRDVFRAKAGKGRELIQKFKAAAEHMPKEGVHGRRILTDVVADYWTIVMETEVEDLDTFFRMLNTRPSNPRAEQEMKGYTDLVEGGYREILRIE